MTLPAGTRLGPYEIVAPLGAGGMGEVFRARDTRLERDVAIKVLPHAASADPAARARLLREARLASRLNHPNVCTIHEVGEADGRTFIVMEVVEGESLGDRLARGALPFGEILRNGIQVADALSHAHGHGVLHRDLKSANVVVTADGRAKVLDFGLAKQMAGPDDAEATTLSRAALTAEGTVAGTLAYMAPEQLRGLAADARSDLWALGVVLYEMATGERPFRAAVTTALAADIQYKEPAPPRQSHPNIPPALEDVILRCLKKRPEERYQTAGSTPAVGDVVEVRFTTRNTGGVPACVPQTRLRYCPSSPLGLTEVTGLTACRFDPPLQPGPVGTPVGHHHLCPPRPRAGRHERRAGLGGGAVAPRIRRIRRPWRGRQPRLPRSRRRRRTRRTCATALLPYGQQLAPRCGRRPHTPAPRRAPSAPCSRSTRPCSRFRPSGSPSRTARWRSR